MKVDGKMRDNRLGWSGHMEKIINDNIVKKIAKMRVEEYRRRGRPKKKEVCKCYRGRYEDTWSK